jgi:general secretion pathway protein L
LNTLYLRIPPKHTAAWPHSAIAYAVGSQEGSIIREGRSTLSELAASISKSNVILLIAASDVTLLELTIPPMTEAKLKLALPTLVEDQLMCDSAECVFLLGTKPQGTANGKRSIAVAQRSWLQQLSGSLFALGANHIKALPAQLCLPWKKGQCSVRLEDQASEATLRFDEDSGVGMLLDTDQSTEDRLLTIDMLASAGSVSLQLPSKLVNEFKSAIKANPAWDERFTVQEANWSATVTAAKTVSFNLMAGLNSAQTHRIQWQMWRWPLILATLILLINIAGLNYDYWNLKREAQGLRQGMLQTYKASFPKDTVVVFPLEQMRKNLDIAQRSSGQPSADDFTMLLTQFGAAWNTLNADQLPKLVSIEYKDHALVLQLKGPVPQKELQLALDTKGLVLKKNNAEVWQVRNAK